MTQVVSIEVRPEGSHVHRHTAMLLDLKNRANVIRFMNVIVDETPVIPYEVSQPQYEMPVQNVQIKTQNLSTCM